MRLRIGWSSECATKTSGWRYIPGDHMLVIPARLKPYPDDVINLGIESQSMDETDLFCLLHELGHAHYRHKSDDNPVVVLAQEWQAWQYAIDCLKPEAQAACAKWASECLATYQKEVKKNESES